MISSLVFLAVSLYLLLRIILPLPAALPVKLLSGAALLLVAQHYSLVRIFFGGFSSPEVPVYVLILSGWLSGSLLFLFLLALGCDILILARRIARFAASRGRRGSAGAFFSPGRRQALLVCMAAVPAAYAVRQAVNVPETRSLEVRLPRLPRALDGFTLAQISDLHISSLLREGWVKAVVERTNSLRPDLIVLTGDIVDGSPASRNDSVAGLRGLRAPLGVFACVGNHEYYSGFGAWMKKFPSLGVEVLLNRHRLLEIQGQKLVLAGLADPVAARYGLPLPDLASALAGAPEEAVRILLDHRPARAEENALAGVDLQLSGHTHGGQILGLAGMVARFNRGYVRGWYKVRDMRLYVSSGAGLWSGFPLRLGVPSEICGLTLRRA
ncbi:MAG: metallophosphoesterase [Deltaproteobacteria bacterium]|jgi:predicted MPP superfamily phosphohydrolase|nr:metallophosphoesterase [Deltaproteobacteria bacterium]